MVKKEESKVINQWLFNNKKSLIVILALSFVLYGNTIGHYYNMDDVFVVKNNEMVQKGIKAIPKILSSRYYESEQAKFGYRPFTKVVFAIEVSLFGTNSHISHFINILLYALLVFITLLWLKRIFGHETGIIFIWVALILWMFHPIHTEVVSSLKNREEILYLLFAIWSSILFMDYIEKGKIYKLLFAGLLFIVAYLSKQSAISFALILPAVFFFKYIKTINIKKLIKEKFTEKVFLIRIAASVIFLWTLSYIMYKLPLWLFPPDDLELFSFENPLRYNQIWSARFSVAALTMIFYLRLLIFPHPLLFYYGLYTLPEVNLSSWIVWVSVAIHIVILIFCIANYSKNKYLLSGFIIYLVAIFPFSNYMMEINGIVADRFLNGPSLGFSIFITGVIFYFFKIPFSLQSIKPISSNAKLLLIGILLIYGIKTISRNADWKDEITLFSHDIEYLDESVKANDILAQTIMDRIMHNNPLQYSFQQLKPSLDSVLRYYQRSLELFPKNPKALNNIANLYINFYNQPDKAQEYLLKAYEFKPDNFELNFNLGMSYEMQKNDSLAIKFYTKALKIEKKYPKLWQSIINFYFKKNIPDSAMFYATEMLKYDSLTDIPETSLGYYYLINKDTVKAASLWEKAFAKNPNNYQRALTLGQYFNSKKDTVKAKYYFEKASVLKQFQTN